MVETTGFGGNRLGTHAASRQPPVRECTTGGAASVQELRLDGHLVEKKPQVAVELLVPATASVGDPACQLQPDVPHPRVATGPTVKPALPRATMEAIANPTCDKGATRAYVLRMCRKLCGQKERPTRFECCVGGALPPALCTARLGRFALERVPLHICGRATTESSYLEPVRGATSTEQGMPEDRPLHTIDHASRNQHLGRAPYAIASRRRRRETLHALSEVWRQGSSTRRSTH